MDTMNEYKVWDLHCDTLYALLAARENGRPQRFDQNGGMVDLQRLRKGNYMLQCFACFVDLGEQADPLIKALQEADLFARLIEAYPNDLMWVRTAQDVERLPADGRIGAMLTAEEGGICRNDPAVLRTLYRLGVRMMTLTWNHKNGLAEPNVDAARPAAPAWPMQPNTAGGLTPLGIEFLAEMERLHMIVDVSHLSDAGIGDVLRYGKRPFAASHSNARACCPHARNLTDEMLREMGSRGCLVGLNYCPAFLDAAPDRSRLVSRVADMARHLRHMIDVGGEDLVALGSDFDGIGGKLEIAGAQDMPRLAQALLAAGFTPRQVEKLFWRNAARFFRENL